ncbi:hypothetical protein FJY84_05400 [Candidatus Bathyarchaeota archaeon]|nr:hypothetical protein [Candidatus Bathyarchaeota archaeon]
MAKLTIEQAELGLKFFSIWRADPEVPKISNWISNEMNVNSYEEYRKKFPEGSAGARYFSTYGRYLDILGTFVREDLIPTDFVLDALGGSGWTPKIKLIVDGLRKSKNNPLLFQNWEYLGNQIMKLREDRLKEFVN